MIRGLLLLAICAPLRVDAQKPIRDDDRAYSQASENRGYVAARCAALYSEFAQEIIGANDRLSAVKESEAYEFLKRVPNPLETVFLDWSGLYKAQFAQQSDPNTPLWGKDYKACSGVLLLIRTGDNLGKYSRRELRYLMGGDSARLPK